MQIKFDFPLPRPFPVCTFSVSVAKSISYDIPRDLTQRPSLEGRAEGEGKGHWSQDILHPANKSLRPHNIRMSTSTIFDLNYLRFVCDHYM